MLIITLLAASAVNLLFAEELGLVLEVSASNAEKVCSMYTQQGVPCSVVGQSTGQGASAMVGRSF